MTKRKKKVIISIFSVLLACVLLFVFVWFAPYGRHKVSNKEPFETEEFFSKPDSIAYIYAGIFKTLSEEKRDQVYELLMSLFVAENEILIDRYLGDLPKEEFLNNVLTSTTFEFRYEQRRRFVGVFDGGTTPVIANEIRGPYEFDAILVSYSDTQTLTVVLYRDDQYLFRHGYWFFYTPRYNAETFENFEKEVKKIV